MFFNEHNPPHFYAEYQEFQVSISIEGGIVEGKMPKRALKLIFEWLEIHKDELIENWKSIEESGDYNKIEPLRRVEYFKKFTLGNWTLNWENELDLSPEYLYDLAMRKS